MKSMIIAGLSILALTATAASAQTTGAAATSGTYGSIGILNDHNTRTDTDLGGINLRLGQRFNQNWGVEGEAAYGTNTDQKRPDGTAKDESGTSLDYGVGAQYHMAPNYALRADWTQSDYTNDHGTANTATLSLVRQF